MNETDKALKESIANHGQVFRPVLKDEHGHTIEGAKREQIAKDLGIPLPVTTVPGMTKAEKDQLRMELNFLHSGGTLKEKKRICKVLLARTPKAADRSLGRLVKLDNKTVGKLRDQMEASEEIPQLTKRVGGDGKVRAAHPAIITTTARQAVRAQKALIALGKDAPARSLTVRSAEKLARQKEYRKIPPMPKVKWPDLITIRHADFRKLPVEDRSVDLILTDPPYRKEFVPLLGPFAEWAKEKLKPNGVVAFYYGTYYLDEAYRAFGDWEYLYQLVVVSDGGGPGVKKPLCRHRNVMNGYKPVLLFAQKPKRFPKAFCDVILGTGAEKEWHEWQQSLDESQFLLKNLSGPKDLIVDPFGGGFTTAVACLSLGRKCITGDVNRVFVERGKVRIAEFAKEAKVA